MKRIVTTILIAFIIFNIMPVSSYATTTPPEIIGETGVVIDAKTGQVLYNKNMNEQRYPASTTKTITALLALENLDMDTTVTIDAETPFTEGSRIYLLEGEKVTVEQLMYALLLESANDSAVALGKQIAGTIPDFANMMNKRAKELGALNTNFVNPNGLHDEAHLSTAYDLAMIAKSAMENQLFRDFVSTYKYIIPATNMQDTRYLYNTNRLLYDKKTKVLVNGVQREAKYEGAIGIKTGYTSHAGGCLIAGAKRGDTELIAVVMKSTDEGRFADCIALLDYGFENYKSVKAIGDEAVVGEVKVSRGKERIVEAIAAKAGYATLPVEASSQLVTTKVKLDEKVKAPIKAGQKLGTIEIYEGDILLSEVDAVAAVSIEEGGIFSIFHISDGAAKIIKKVIISILAIFVFLFVSYVLLKRRQIRRRRKRRAEREARMRQEQERMESFRHKNII